MNSDSMTFRKRLLSSIKSNENWRVKSMLKSSTLRQSLDTFGATLLRYSAQHGNLKIVGHLLDEGCDEYIDAQDSKGRTALMRALQGRHYGIVELLLDEGADPLLSNHENKSALQMICAEHDLSTALQSTFFRHFRHGCSSSEEAAKKLIDAGCHLYQAVYTKDAKILEYMLERGFSADSTIAGARSKALHLAVALDSVESVEVLLKHGADVDAIDSRNRSPLYYVYLDANGCPNAERSAEKVEMLRLLFARGVSPTSCSVHGDFQAIHTLIFGDSAAIRVVLSRWDFAAKDCVDGGTVLHYLATNSNPGVVDELRVHSREFDANALVNDNDESPLHAAAINGNVEMLEFLLARGADVNYAEPRRGRTSLYYAYAESMSREEEQYRRCVELLLQNGADPRFVVNGKSGARDTIFEAASRGKCDSDALLEPAVARLAMLEESGAAIPEAVREKIDARPKLKIYYDRCRRVLGREIHGTVTPLKLLSGSERKLAKYASNTDLLLKLKRVRHKQRVRTSFPYYYNTIMKRFSKGIELRRLIDGAAGGVCNIFGDSIDRTHVVVDRVSDYLNVRDFQRLCQL